MKYMKKIYNKPMISVEKMDLTLLDNTTTIPVSDKPGAFNAKDSSCGFYEDEDFDE